VASAYCIQQAEKCRAEAARARDDDIRAYWKKAERCWLALVQNNEPQPWPFVSKETEKVRLRTQGTLSLGPSDHVAVVVQDGDIVVSVAGLCAVYYKPNNQPQLILRRRSETDDQTLLAQAWRAANDKARELGWIV
jgi:hypothetical protein